MLKKVLCHWLFVESYIKTEKKSTQQQRHESTIAKAHSFILERQVLQSFERNEYTQTLQMSTVALLIQLVSIHVLS